MNARNVIIDPVEAFNQLHDNAVPTGNLNRHLQEMENIPSDRLDSELKARISIFIKGFSPEATLDDVKALFVSKTCKNIIANIWNISKLKNKNIQN